MRPEEHVGAKSMRIKDFCKACDLEVINVSELEYITFYSMMVNRPGLMFAGFDEYFGAGRVQLIGNAENYYLCSLSPEDKKAALKRLLSRRVPGVIFARGIMPDSDFTEEASRYGVPLFASQVVTTRMSVTLSNFLSELLATEECVHGTLMEITGLGVLITGDSGMGKSETAIELINRGHRLVADDAVIVKRVADKLLGTAPEKTKFYMEVRGIGIIDVRRMYGVGAILNSEHIDLVLDLKKWEENVKFDRLGNNNASREILGVQVPMLTLPVMPGRNLAIVAEVAARNFRLQSMGFDALQSMLEGK